MRPWKVQGWQGEKAATLADSKEQMMNIDFGVKHQQDQTQVPTKVHQPPIMNFRPVRVPVPPNPSKHAVSICEC